MISPRLVLSSLFTLAAGSCLTATVAAWRGKTAMRRAPQRGQLVTGKGGARIHVETYGPASGQPLILVHGMMGSTYDMTATLVPEIEDEYRVYVVDRPGFGHSPHLKNGDDLLSQARAIRDAVHVLDHRRPMVLGHSYGGSVALQMALDAPEALSALILLAAPSHGWDDQPPLEHHLLGTPILGPILAYLIAAFFPKHAVVKRVEQAFSPQLAPAEYCEHFQPEQALRPSTLQLNSRQRKTLKPQLEGLVKHYPTLGLPIESLHGTQDITVSHRVHAQSLDTAVQVNHLKLLPTMGHMLHHCAIADVEDAIHRAAARAEF